MLYDKRWDRTDAQQALYAAADHIERHGWCRGEISNSKGSVCLIGALIHSVSCPRVRARAYAALEKYIGMKCIYRWNDDICQTKQQAIEALINAAE